MVSRDALMMATLIMSMVSMLLSCMALWPQCKEGLVVARDGFLWFALVATMAGVATMAWRHYGGEAAALVAPYNAEVPIENVDWVTGAPAQPTHQAMVER